LTNNHIIKSHSTQPAEKLQNTWHKPYRGIEANTDI